MSRYLISIERTSTGYSAYSPDLPGCASTGETRLQVANNMKEAIEFLLRVFGSRARPFLRLPLRQSFAKSEAPQFRPADAANALGPKSRHSRGAAAF